MKKKIVTSDSGTKYELIGEIEKHRPVILHLEVYYCKDCPNVERNPANLHCDIDHDYFTCKLDNNLALGDVFSNPKPPEKCPLRK